MGRRRGRPAATAIALGVAIGVVLALGVRTIALGDGPRVAESTVNAVALGVAVAALALSFIARRGGRRAPAWVAVAGGTLASLAVAVWIGLGNDVVRFHTWEHFHYYLGAKYFRELSYSRLYACTAVVEAERVGLEETEGRRMRDLATDEVVPVDGALAQPDECKRRFTPERWRAFGDDVMFFRGAMGGMWDRMQQDHGYNPPPTWALAGGVLASIAPASAGTQTALGLIDPLLLATMLGLVGWAFGAHVLFVAIVVWACQLPGAATWTSAAFLRQDWLLCLVASVCFARRGWPALAGLAIASSAALRVFPALLLVLPMVVIARRTWRHGRLGRFDARFLAGAQAARRRGLACRCWPTGSTRGVPSPSTWPSIVWRRSRTTSGFAPSSPSRGTDDGWRPCVPVLPIPSPCGPRAVARRSRRCTARTSRSRPASSP